MADAPGQPGPVTFNLLPRPVSTAGAGASTELADGCVIDCDASLVGVGAMLRGTLAAATGWDVALGSAASAATGNVIRLHLDAAISAEGYHLAVAADGVTITASAPAGVFYGVQTLRQLLPADTLRTAPPGSIRRPVTVPGVVIDDEPRLAWRGVHLDVARHFMPKDWVLRLIDLLALHKINVLHLHLTDDQGWRIPIDRYPRLIEVGAWRRLRPIRTSATVPRASECGAPGGSPHTSST